MLSFKRLRSMKRSFNIQIYCHLLTSTSFGIYNVWSLINLRAFPFIYFFLFYRDNSSDNTMKLCYNDDEMVDFKKAIYVPNRSFI